MTLALSETIPEDAPFRPYFRNLEGSITIPGRACVYSVGLGNGRYLAQLHAVVYGFCILRSYFQVEVVTEEDVRTVQDQMVANYSANTGRAFAPWKEAKVDDSMCKELLGLWAGMSAP